MIIARGMLMMLRIAFAIICVVGVIMVFPIWFSVCDTILTLLVSAIGLGEEMGTMGTMFLAVFPYGSLFIVGLAFYIGLTRLLDGATGSGGSKEDLDGI